MTRMCLRPDGEELAAISSNSMHIFSTNEEDKGKESVYQSDFKLTCISWSPYSDQILVGTKCGKILHFADEYSPTLIID